MREGGPGVKTDPEGNLVIAERVWAFSPGPFVKGREERQIGRNTAVRRAWCLVGQPVKQQPSTDNHQQWVNFRSLQVAVRCLLSREMIIYLKKDKDEEFGFHEYA